MADISRIIDELLLELSVHYPIPNMGDREQIITLMEICDDLGYGYIKPTLYEMLSEAEGNKESGLFPGKFHLGGGYYSSKEGGEAEFKNEKGNLRPVTPEEKAKFDAKGMPVDKEKKPSAETPSDTTDTQTKPEQPKDTLGNAPKAGIGKTVKTLVDKPQVVKQAITNKVKDWSDKEKEFFNKGEDKPGSPTRRSWKEALMDKAKGARNAIAHGLKHEYHTFKSAADGLHALVHPDREVTPEHKKAMFSVGVKIAMTAATAGVGGALAHGVGSFASHVAMELVPHVVAETVILGIGKASLFADVDGEDERILNDFAASIADKMENMEITDEMMLQMVESYNEKRGTQNTEQPKAENEIIDLNELFNRILNEEEGTGESKEFPGKFHLGGGYYASKKDGDAEFKNEKGNLRPLTPEEKVEYEKGKKGDSVDAETPTTEKPAEEPTPQKPEDTETKEKDLISKTQKEFDTKEKELSKTLSKDNPDRVLNDPKASAQSKAMARAFKAQQNIDKINKEESGEGTIGEPVRLEPATEDVDSKVNKFRGKKSGKDIQTIELDGGGMIFGTVHRNTEMVDDIIDQIKATIPQEKWKDVVFVGEGGATNKETGELEFNDEMDYAVPKFKQLGAGVDTFDGDDLDVHKPNSKLYQKQKEKTGLNQSQVNAGNWASMIGQGEGTDTMQPSKFLDDEGKNFLQDAAKEAGFPPIENWDEPTEQDTDTLYRLSFPEDNGDKETKINDIQVAFNQIRDENLIEKSKELAAKGKIPITIAGEGHVDLVDKMMRGDSDKKSETKNVEPEKIVDEMPKADSETFAKDGKALDGIEPQQLEQFNTDISKVAKMIDDAKAKGEKAPDINLCDITIPGTNLYCDDNQGIPREEMPQFKGKAIEGSRAAEMETDKSGEVDTEPVFREMLKQKGIKVLQTEVPADKLKATQKDLVGEKVVGMMGALEKDPNHPKITAPIYVSRDGYVIDGHHRWAAVVAYNAKHPDNPIPMKTTVIDMDIKDAIPMANKFAEDMGIAAKKADATDGEGPKPKEPKQKEGGVIYPLGGGYYSDTKGGPAQYIKAENVVKEVFIGENIKFLDLLFEDNLTMQTPSGKEVMVKPIDVKDQPEANKEAESAKEVEDIAGNSRAKEFTKKSETTERLFATKENYKTVKTADKEYTVRPLTDPETGDPIDTNSPEGRKKAIEITRKRLDDLKEKSVRAVDALNDKTLNKAQRQLIHKWLGEYGELQAYASLLESDKVKDVYLFTDSEVKNDILVIGKSDDERTIIAWGVSVKAAQQDTMANKRGSSVKPDFDKALDGAESRDITIDGVSGNVDTGVVMNSMLELRKQIIKKVSDGKARQDDKTGSTLVKLEDGREVLITEFLREQKVTEKDIDEVFDLPTIQKAIRGLSNEKVDEKQANELLQHFRNKFKEYVKDGATIKDIEDKMIEEFVSIFDNVGANLTPSTDIMISYYNEGGFTENKFITKEDSERKILDVMGVGKIEDISKVEQFRKILGLDFTGRGAGKKKQGKGYVDGQSFGRPDKNLQPDPITLDDYIGKHF